MLDSGLRSKTARCWITIGIWEASLHDSTESGRRQKSSGSETTLPLRAATEPALIAATVQPSVREFEYLATGEVGPGKRALRRPALGVTLLNDDGQHLANARALVDSGADFTTFSAEWAALLHIDLDEDCTKEPVTVASGATAYHYVYTDGLEVEVVGEKLKLDVVKFCKGLRLAYLGRKDFFGRYLVLFDQRELRFFLERRIDPDEGDDDDGIDAHAAVTVTSSS